MTRPTRGRSVLAIPGGRAVHHVGLDLAHGVKANAQSIHHTRPVALHHHIGLGRQFHKGRLTGFGLQIDLDALDAAARTVGMKRRANLLGPPPQGR